MENYRIAHGEAVAIGMVIEAHLSHQKGYLPLEKLQEIETLCKSYRFDLLFSQKITPDDLIQAMMLDKKSSKKEPRFVLLSAIGSPLAFDGAYCAPIDPPLLKKTLQTCLPLFYP
ncbi:MAG: hypothetical protein HYZ48_01315 [Chlamydiales bacterium]|nr:hypothetical protein [Chlamydiales bacterium]